MRDRQWAGLSLAVAGALTLFINAVITPQISQDVSFAETAASSTFLWRQSLSALVAVLLISGSLGASAFITDVAQKAGKPRGLFASMAFKGAFLGSVFLLAHEWTQVFYVHDVAMIAPDALAAQESREGMGVSDIGVMLSLFCFTFGWIAFAVSMLRSDGITKLGPILIIAGFFAMPMLSAALSGTWGLILGNAVLSAGWFSVGRDLYRAE